MKKYIIEKEFEVEGFKCVILGSYFGHRCGYIAIPKEHELYGKDYDSIDIDIHGGFTYAEYSEGEYPIKSDENVWWIGFDCAHYMDAKDLNLMDKFEDKELLEYEISLREKLGQYGTVKTVEYVENELINAVKQIKEKYQ